tara:strand:+ start:452 stop:619 length:168 start_codon:yes stop_codon:yes gene_type:complete
MLEIKDIPDFKYVLVHIGNFRKDTLACLLTGMSNNADDALNEVGLKPIGFPRETL